MNKIKWVILLLILLVVIHETYWVHLHGCGCWECACSREKIWGLSIYHVIAMFGLYGIYWLLERYGKDD